MKLEELVDVSVLEDRNTELKSRLDRTNIDGWIKTVGGFANAEGGTMFFGVKDRDGLLMGYERHEADAERNFFNNVVNEHIFPRPDVRFSFLRYEINERELFIIRAEIKESPIKPVVVNYGGIPSIYMRRDGFTNGASYEEIIDMSLKSSRVQFDMTDSEVPYSRSDFSALFSFFSSRNDGRELTDKALASMGFFNDDRKLKNGAVIFMDGYNSGMTCVKCSAYSGMNKGSERVVSVSEYNGNLVDSISFITEFVKIRMNHSFIKLADRRVNIDAYPERALFEAAVNAVAHRDYYLNGTQIQVDMFKDRLEISSPGSLYGKGRLGRTYDLSNIISKRRNRLICSVLVACNVMEAAGTGFDKIISDYSNADERHKPFIFSDTDHFTLVLPDMTYTDGVLPEDMPEVHFPIPKNTSDHDKGILSFCYYKERKAGEIASALGLSDSSYFRKNVLENLVMQNYLLREKKSGAVYFRTNREIVFVEI